MRWMRNIGLGEISPSSALLIGAVIGIAGMPAVKKIVRGLAVSAVGAVMSANEFVKDAGGNASSEWKKLMEEARTGRSNDKHMRDHLFEAGVGIAGAGIAVVEKTKEKISNLKAEIAPAKNDLVEVAETMQEGVQEVEDISNDNHERD